MKNILLLTSLLISCTLFGQDAQVTPVATKTGHELGANLTFFVKQFIDFGNGDNGNRMSPYAVTYKYVKNKRAFRTAIGGSYDRISEDLEGTNATRENQNMEFDYRFGYERQFNIGKNFISTIGVDFVGNTASNKTVGLSGFGTVTTKTKVNGLGLRPMVGFEYVIKEKVALGTEMGLIYMHTIEKSTVAFDGVNSPNSESKKTRDQVNFDFPTSLFIIVKF